MIEPSLSASRAWPEPAEVALPAPVIAAAPVLICDCATPVAGETLLSLLLRRMARDG